MLGYDCRNLRTAKKQRYVYLLTSVIFFRSSKPGTCGLYLSKLGLYNALMLDRTPCMWTGDWYEEWCVYIQVTSNGLYVDMSKRRKGSKRYQGQAEGCD